MTISKKGKTYHFKHNTTQHNTSFNYYFIIFFTLFPTISREKSLKIMKDTALLELILNRFTL